MYYNAYLASLRISTGWSPLSKSIVRVPYISTIDRHSGVTTIMLCHRAPPHSPGRGWTTTGGRPWALKTCVWGAERYSTPY